MISALATSMTNGIAPLRILRQLDDTLYRANLLT